MHPPALRVGHPHSGLRQISENKIYTENFLSADAPIRSAGHPIRTQYLVVFRQNFQKSPSLVRPHWGPVRVNPSALTT